jgi:hypothetical protein
MMNKTFPVERLEHERDSRDLEALAMLEDGVTFEEIAIEQTAVVPRETLPQWEYRVGARMAAVALLSVEAAE